MECLNSTRAISVLLDLAESEQDFRELTEHVEACQICSDTVNECRRLRQNLRNLPVRHPSVELKSAIGGIAFRERSRRIAWLNVVDTFTAWRVWLEMLMTNMMRPMAVPVAGGLVSAILLFATMLPDFAREVHPIPNDVPTGLFTDASVKDAFWPVIGDTDVVVDLTIDESGRLTDYSFVSGSSLLRDEGMRRRFESALLLTQFTPATTFGQPTAGKVRVSFRTSRIDIKG
jgi:hypothetical protein